MPIVYTLQPTQWNCVLRFVKQASRSRVLQLQSIVTGGMKRLELEANDKKAVAGLPDGSDHFNIQNTKLWVDKIRLEHRFAKRQLVALDATITKRIDL